MSVKSADKSSIYSVIISLAITIGIAVFLLFIMIFILSSTPWKTIYFFFAGPFTNKYYFGNMLNASVPLILTGLGISFAFKSSNFNLGGEGQVYAGGLAAAFIALSLPALNGFEGILLGIISAALLGAFIAGISGFLKYKWNTDELISSFLISNALIYIINYVITGVLHDPDSNLLTTCRFPEQYWLSGIFPPSNLNTSLFLALAAAAVSWFAMYRTHLGYELRITGLNAQFAAYGGINVKKYMVIPMLLSGAFHGLAGSLAVYGTQHMLFKGFSAGMGWNGIAVALIASNNPIAVVPAAVFFAYIEAGAKSAMINSDVTIEIALIVKAVIFYLVTASALRGIKLKKWRKA